MIARFGNAWRRMCGPVHSDPTAGVGGAVSAEGAVLGLIVASAVIRLWAAWGAGLCYGESYYFSCARHPNLSYFDQPPLSILIGSASLYLSGEVGPLILRGPFIAMFAGTSWLLFVLGRKLFGPWPGFYAVLLLNLAPVFSLSVGIFFQPDGPLMFFWLACVWCLTHLLLEPAPARPLLWWAAAGAMLGLGLLSKYQSVLLVPGVGLYLLWRRDQRRWVAHVGPYLALGVATLLIAPVLVWNSQHHWISFVWQGTRGLYNPQGFSLHFHSTWILANIAGQALELLPWVWVGLLGELVRSFRRAAPPARQLIACLAVVPIALFTAVALYVDIGRTHFHWGMPGYLLLFLPLGDTVDRWLRQGRTLCRWGLGATAVVSILGMTVIATHEATGWLKDVGLAQALEEDRDPTYECIDFTALERAFAERGLLGRKDIFVFSDWWYRAGKVDYGLKGKLPIFALNRNDPRNFAFFDRTERWLGKDGILVTTNDRLDAVSDYYGEFFTRIVPLGAVRLGRHGRHELTLYLYRFEDLRRPYPLPYG